MPQPKPWAKISNYTYDGLARIASASFPDGGSSTFTHVDTPLAASVELHQTIASGVIKDSLLFFDGLGRKTQTELKSDPDGPTFTATTYDALSRTSSVYNPTRCTTPTTNCGELTWGFTAYAYDPLSRVTTVTEPDGSTQQTSYAANCTTVTDEAAKSRRSCVDGPGRLTQVFEDPAGLNYETDYTYDALNNLLTVNQKGGSATSSNWRTRTFTYDSLSRLTQAVNPESGTVTYSYDSDGNLLQKISPAPNQTGSATVTLSYCYDALNRLTGKAYTAQTCSSGLLPTPLVSYFYDQSSYSGLTITNGLGHRTGMSDQAGIEAWSYDVMGRTLSDLRASNSFSKTFTYSYNLDGSLKMLGYPAGANNTYPQVVAYQPGGAGRPLGLTSNGAGFVGDAHYTPSGANCYLQDYWDGTWTSVGTFNNRQQPKTYQVVQQFSGTPPTVCSAMSTVAGIMDFSYNFTDASSHNNGNVQTIFNNADWHRTQSFTYDSLNRIATAQTAADNQPAYQGDNSLAMCWAETYTYDPWGNILTLGANSTTQPNYVGCTQESGFNYTGAIGNNNRIAETGFTYDAAGNMTASPALTYVYDAENHLTQTAGVTYTYDGDGKRVIKSNGLIYWYGVGSDPILETDLSANFKYQYFFFGGQRVGRADGSNSVTWYFGDHLGSSRVVWSTAGNDNSDFYPFGGERVITSGTANTYKFTGKERDLESGLDNFGARYNSSTMARFMSPDAKIPTFKHLSNPQKWNKYSYALDNPLMYRDLDGFQEVSFWHAVAVIASAFKAKVEGGVGVEYGVHAGPLKFKAGAAAKGEVSVSSKGVDISATAEAGAAFKTPIGEIAAKPEAEIQTMKDGEGIPLKDQKVETKTEISAGGKTEGKADTTGEVGLGATVSVDGAVIGADVSVDTKELTQGLGELATVLQLNVLQAAFPGAGSAAQNQPTPVPSQVTCPGGQGTPCKP